MKDINAWLRQKIGYEYRYDAILGGIPALFGLTYLIGAMTFIGELVALLIASLASSLLLMDALFLNPP